MSDWNPSDTPSVAAAFDSINEMVESLAEDHPDVVMVIAAVWPEDEPNPAVQILGNIPKQQAADILTRLAASFHMSIIQEQ